MSFADNLRKARESRGLTQQQVAELLGINKSTYCGYETQFHIQQQKIADRK